MIKILNLFLLIIFFLSCSVSLNQKEDIINNVIESQSNEGIIENPFFSMRRTPCFGQCPTYTVSFYKDGSVIYEGRRFVKNEGLYSANIDIKTVALIKDKIRAVDFFNFDSIYDARISDLPSVILEVKMDKKTHKVIDRYKGPDELREFERFIDDIVLKIENGLVGRDWQKIMQ